MTADEVLAIIAVLRGFAVWIGGGWGIDALVGEQTREHRDLDLMHREDQESAVVAALADADFVEMLDWRPVRFVVADPAGREIDLHPLTFAVDGVGGAGVAYRWSPVRLSRFVFRHGNDPDSHRPVPVGRTAGLLPSGLPAGRPRPSRHGPAPTGIRNRHPLLSRPAEGRQWACK